MLALLRLPLLSREDLLGSREILQRDLDRELRCWTAEGLGVPAFSD